jgi:hypothetical protein
MLLPQKLEETQYAKKEMVVLIAKRHECCGRKCLVNFILHLAAHYIHFNLPLKKSRNFNMMRRSSSAFIISYAYFKNLVRSSYSEE